MQEHHEAITERTASPVAHVAPSAHRGSYPLLAEPQQQRSRDSLERVLRAGLEVLQREGFDGFTVQKASKLAQVSIGSIYARFSNREALILAIYEWAMAWTDELEQRFELEEILSAEGPRARIEGVVENFARVLLEHSDRWRVFVRQAPVHPEIFARGREKTREYHRRFEQALLPTAASFRHDDATKALSTVFTIVFSSVTRRISHGADFDGSEMLSDEQLAKELGTVAADYLL